MKITKSYHFCTESSLYEIFINPSGSVLQRDKKTLCVKKLKPFTTNYGYQEVVGDERCYLVHRLLALAFIPNPLNLEFVDHIDSDRSNNSLNNLRWVTRTTNNSTIHAKSMKSLNARHESRKGLAIKATKDNNTQIFRSVAEIAKNLSVSKPFVYCVLKKNDTRTVKGWHIEWISLNDPKCNNLVQILKQEEEFKNNQKHIKYMEKLQSKKLERLKQKQEKNKIKLLKKQQRLDNHIIFQLDKNNIIVKEWKSMAEITRSLNKSVARKVKYSCQTGRLVGGFFWKYKIPH